MAIICEWCGTPYDEDNPEEHRSCITAAIKELGEKKYERIAELEADKEQHLRVIESLKEDVARLTRELEKK